MFFRCPGRKLISKNEVTISKIDLFVLQTDEKNISVMILFYCNISYVQTILILSRRGNYGRPAKMCFPLGGVKRPNTVLGAVR